MTEIPLPFDYLTFYDLYYINNKFYAIVVTGDPYDVRFELDEEKCKLKGNGNENEHKGNSTEFKIR